jgi:hypothetical protein
VFLSVQRTLFLSFFLSVSLYLFPDVFCFFSYSFWCPGGCSTHFLPLHLRPHHYRESLLGGQSDNTLFESCHLLQAAPNSCARLLFKSPLCVALLAAAAAALACLTLQLWKKKHPTYFGTLARFFIWTLLILCSSSKPLAIICLWKLSCVFISLL